MDTAQPFEPESPYGLPRLPEEGTELVFILFVSLTTAPSFEQRIRRILRQMPVQCQFWVFDVESRADMAERFNVVATPMLIRQHVQSGRRSSLIGDCCDGELQSFVLDLRVTSSMSLIEQSTAKQSRSDIQPLQSQSDDVQHQIDELEKAILALQKATAEQQAALQRQRDEFDRRMSSAKRPEDFDSDKLSGARDSDANRAQDGCHPNDDG